MRAQVKYFSDWIEHEPKEKWSFLHDRGDARYGIMTTNLAKVYNWIICSIRCLPLVGIVVTILRGTTNYIVDRSNNTSLAVDDQIVNLMK